MYVVSRNVDLCILPLANVLPKVAMVLTIAVGVRLTEGEGETRGRLKGSNHKEQEQRRFVGTLYITPPLVPWSPCALSRQTQNTHSCLFQIFDTKWQNERPRGASSSCRGVLQTKYIRL